MKAVRGIIVAAGIMVVAAGAIAAVQASDARRHAQEAIAYARSAYEFAQKANYNSEGRTKYYAYQAMQAAKKAEEAGLGVIAALDAEEKGARQQKP